MSAFEIVNIVGTINFQKSIALDPLASSLADHRDVNRINYEPDELHLIHSWLFEDNTYVGFYKNGSCSVTGVSSLDKFYEITHMVNNIVEEILDFQYESVVAINNIVVTSELDDIPSLEAVAVGLGLEQTEYEPEQFPALIYRNKKAVILIFASGKLICTGLTDLDEISSAICKLTTKIDSLAVS